MGEGSAIVNIGAVVGRRGFPGDTPYGSAKAGLEGLTTSLAIELARDQITVNVVVPGFTETEMTGELDERAREKIIKGIPLRRPAKADEIAQVVEWVSDSRYMTGSIVHVDGGLRSLRAASHSAALTVCGRFMLLPFLRGIGPDGR